MVSRLLVPLLCTGALALACGPRSHTEASSHGGTTRVDTEQHVAAKRAAERSKRAKHDGEIVPMLQVAATGAGVRFELAVENAGNKSLEMHFADGQTHDIIVLDTVGREVWRWADGRLFTQAHRSKVIGGGDTLRVAETWEAPPKGGRYVAVAKLKSTNYPIEERVEFVVQ